MSLECYMNRKKLKSNAISDPKMAATVDQSNQSLDLNVCLCLFSCWYMLVQYSFQEVFWIIEVGKLSEWILEILLMVLISIPLTLS